MVTKQVIELRKEFKKHAIVGITGAFAFLIALSWRTPIQETIDKMIEYLNLTGDGLYLKYLSAIAITVIGALALMIMARWSKEEKKKVKSKRRKKKKIHKNV
jgi:hypothetical protein